MPARNNYIANYFQFNVNSGVDTISFTNEEIRLPVNEAGIYSFATIDTYAGKAVQQVTKVPRQFEIIFNFEDQDTWGKLQALLGYFGNPPVKVNMLSSHWIYYNTLTSSFDTTPINYQVAIDWEPQIWSLMQGQGMVKKEDEVTIIFKETFDPPVPTDLIVAGGDSQN